MNSRLCERAQITAIREHESEYDQLGQAEKFFLEIAKVKRYGQRLEALNFKRVFNDRIAEARKVRSPFHYAKRMRVMRTDRINGALTECGRYSDSY